MDEDRRDKFERFRKIDEAFKTGDLAALRSAVDDPASIPNGAMPLEVGPCLEYAIYHSPLAFIRTLLEIGADVSPEDHAGFPPLIAALSCVNPQQGAPGRGDVLDVLALLLAHGADPGQRGVNDYAALHMAVEQRSLAAVKVLLESGADPHARTRIDDYETPREMAERAGLPDIAALLASYEAKAFKRDS